MSALRAILEWVWAQLVLIILVVLVMLLIGLLVVFGIVGFSDPASAWSAWVYCFFSSENEKVEKFQILEFIGVGMGGVLLAIAVCCARTAFVNALRAILIALLIVLFVIFVTVGVFDPAWVYRFFGVETGTGKFQILEFIGVGMVGVLLAIAVCCARTAFVNALRAILKRVRKSPGLTIIILIVSLIVLLVVFGIVGFSDPASAWSVWVYRFFGVETETGKPETGTGKSRILEFIGVGMGGVLLAIGATAANRRARAMEETNRGAEAGRRQELLKDAIEHLGDKSDLVRLGGVYELFHLARDTEDLRLRQTVMNILCAHIRRTTGDAKYRWTHKPKPSEEVQSLLTLLFVQEHKVFRGCHIDLQGSWLNGADLIKAHLPKANLFRAQLQDAKLLWAQLQGVNLYGAQLQGAILQEAQLQGANLFRAQLQGASLHDAQLQGAILQEAQLQGANLLGTQLQGANLLRTQLQGANLIDAQLQGVILQGAGLQTAATLTDVQLQGATTNQNLKNLSFEERIRNRIGQGTAQSVISNLPLGHRATTGVYTEEEAERWIAEYNEATGEA